MRSSASTPAAWPNTATASSTTPSERRSGAKAFAYLRDLREVASEAAIGEVMGVGPESPGRLWWAGEHERAVKAAERDLAVAASFGNFEMRVQSICRLAQAHHTLGDYGRAADLLRQIVASLQGDLVHEHFGMAAFPSVWARSWLSWCLAERGEFAEGTALSEEAARIAESAEHPYSRAQFAFGLGTLYVVQGRPDRAIPLLEQGLVVARMANIPFLSPFLIGPLGAAYALAGEPARAVDLLEQAVEQGISMKLRAHHALRLAWLARAHLVLARREPAVDHARRALDLARECKERGQEAYAHLVLADIAAGGETPANAEAEASYRQALALAEALGMRPLAAQCRLGLGLLYQRAGERQRAREDLAAAAALFGAMGMTRWLAEAERGAAG